MSEQQQPVAWRITDGEGGYRYYDEEPELFNVDWATRYGRKYEPLVTADYAEAVRQQRDELLAALEECLAAYRYSNRLPETVMEAELKLERIASANNKARAAIAKAKEQA